MCPTSTGKWGLGRCSNGVLSHQAIGNWMGRRQKKRRSPIDWLAIAKTQNLVQCLISVSPYALWDNFVTHRSLIKSCYHFSSDCFHIPLFLHFTTLLLIYILLALHFKMINFCQFLLVGRGVCSLTRSFATWRCGSETTHFRSLHIFIRHTYYLNLFGWQALSPYLHH